MYFTLFKTKFKKTINIWQVKVSFLKFFYNFVADCIVNQLLKQLTRSKLDFDWKSRSWAFAYII